MLLLSLLATLVVLALALGLGLGLGLRGKASSTSTGSVNSLLVGPDGQQLPFVPRSKLVDPSQFRLNPAWDRYAAPTVRSYNWTVSRVISNPAGVTKPVLVVNGMSPGPTIEANIGDTILVSVTNALQNVTTSIHWHGQNQNGTNFMDGTVGVSECGIAPGQTEVYKWTVQNKGTYWWHSHAGRNTEYTDGLVGALILHSPDEVYHLANSTAPSSSSNSTYDEDIVIPVTDAWHSPAAQWLVGYNAYGGIGASYDYPEPVPDTGLVAGYGTGTCDGLPKDIPCDGGQLFNFTFEPSKRYRIRVINTGALAGFSFSVDSHPLTLIEADATEVEPQRLSSFEVQVAQRYSVLIDTNQPPGAYFIRGTIDDDMLGYDNPALNQDQRALMRYSNAPSSAVANDTAPTLPGNLTSLDTDTLRPVVAVQAPQAARREILVVNFGVSTTGEYRAFMNGTSWDMEMANSTLLQAYNAVEASVQYTPPESQYILTLADIEAVDIVIVNQNDGAHPFHMHGYTPMLIGSGTGAFSPSKINLQQTYTNPMRRDVFVVPTYGWSVVRIIADNPGLWFVSFSSRAASLRRRILTRPKHAQIHCHLVSHLSIGLAAQFEVLPQRLKEFQRSDVERGCSAVAAFNAKM